MLAGRQDSHVQYASLLTSSAESSEDELFSIDQQPDDGRSARSSTSSNQPARSWRNLAGFWLLGLCNNYAYVIMLSAAHDILSDDFQETELLEDGGDRDCNLTSTGAILLADVVPALVAKLVSPAVDVHTHIRVAVTILFSAVSFLLVGASVSSAMAYTGVVAASLGSGIGEVTFLAYSAHFHSDVVSTWSSGTGFSGVLGSFSYAALLSAGLSPRNTLFVMLICPAIMTLTYTALLRHPPSAPGCSCCGLAAAPARSTSVSSERSAASSVPLSRQEKLSLLRLLPAFMVPLGLVYFAEYFINQGLVELIWFRNIWLSHSDQYRWLQVIYQVGVFLSRSSVNVFHIERIWILTALQMANAVFFFYEAYYLFLPSYWLVVALVLFEGVLGGAAYVNTFYSVYHKFPGREREFIMGTVSLADSMGIAVAGAISLPVHDALCTLPGPRL
ncbi:battenin-like isoform X1 [Amphibalanus amphitrite]|uniref:battenin-like isoform X1 n=1 Tax=Amphibalanus amphitrite TaxID=1232801 RepID=UPI001C91E259|nr:battenin-like isoform X1 [Amphibalanus amphitrite]XP_043223431.1 battenin-like isoform X1 [Amphibalanus amphitrite]XP_043223440.1 battenin-like isoform X1 [Amphibalanus amphitrite]